MEQDESLDEGEVDPDPLAQFARWYRDALEADLPRADAVALATADRRGFPSVRFVLLKGADARGFTLFTNYESRKGAELAGNSRAALAFFWAELARQVRVTGSVRRLASRESDEYFVTRPRESQLAAWASRQSRPVASRRDLEAEFERLSAEYDGREVPRPPHWGGYLLEPDEIEFWASRLNRMHDRVRYTRIEYGAWRIERLSP